MKKNNPYILTMFCIGLLAAGSLVVADDEPYTYRPGDRGQFSGHDGRVQILPDKFLREYDPVTLFFSGKQSGVKVGPEDAPQRWMTLQPAHQGEYRWIDEKTLEFRPVAPWPPVGSFTVTAGGETRELKTLLATPLSIAPSNGSTDLADVDRITIEFAYPVPVELLKKLVSFEVTPLPGIDRSQSILFGAVDYTIKAGEQKSSGAVAYTFIFKNSFPLASKIRTHVLLSDIPEFAEGKKVYWFSTKSDFRMVRAGTYSAQFNISSTGSVYSVDQALAVDQSGNIVVDFSSQPKNITLSEAKSLFMFSPSPKSFTYSLSGNRMTAQVGLEAERLYKVTLQPVKLKDLLGRTIVMDKPSSFYVFRNPDRQYIRWEKSFGILERYGPQHLPLSLANINAFDLRIYRIDPLYKAFFPFPSSPVTVSEDRRPPGPGEEPTDETMIHDPLDPSSVAQHIMMLGSPHYSEVIDAPAEGIEKQQTIDLKSKLAAIAGKDAPGTYLVGFRELSGKADRQYVKVCVTDLCLTTVESRGEVLFCVSSMSSGKPVPGTRVTVDGLIDNTFQTLIDEKTDQQGMCRVPGGTLYDTERYPYIKRVVLRKDDDCLVLDSREQQAPPMFVRKHWEATGGGWLSGLVSRAWDSSKEWVVRGFVFPERPIYRPEEKVYIKGYVRSLFQGKIKELPFGKVELQINGPENQWTETMILSDVESFNYILDDGELATGEYTVSATWIPDSSGYSNQTIAKASFRVDAYRVPRFEVKLSGPDQVPNDQPFTTNLTASYYAGGRVADCRAEWKVRIFPYTWQFDGWDQYALSSDSRFGGSVSSTDFGTVNEEMKTDDEGSARLVLKPATAPGGNPARYVIEATVTDVDEQTVTDVHSVIALPSFVLALKTDRYVTGSSTVSAKVAAVSCVSGKPIAGQKVKVTLKKMTWHSYLQETDFARGEPRYITEENVSVVDEKTVTTEAQPLDLNWQDRDPGVYIIELSSNDKLGRQQTLKIDLFLAGKKPVVWQKSRQSVFEAVTDKTEYNPGDVARIILKSPYQNGAALAVVEYPDGRPKYTWVSVKDGQAEFSLPIEADMIPRIPVSFLLMRPRISESRRVQGGGYIDAGKPESVANMTWISVKPVENQVTVTLRHDKVQAPGDTMTIEVKLADWKGKPVGGEVTLWLVDEAVLSLGEEMNLDPVPHFIPDVSSNVIMRDTRNFALGRLRDFENPGGDEVEEPPEASDIPITVRKNFKTVPYYEPSLLVGSNGTATVTIPLPDNLTRFAVRAVAVSGVKRFGFSKSSVSVRLPVIVQPSLPRFVRVGDKFKAGGVARVVEGTAGKGGYRFKTEGLQITSKEQSDVWNALSFPEKKALPVYLDMTVPDVKFTKDGWLERDSVMFQMAVRKKGSSKGDAFEVKIPLLADRAPVTRRVLGMVDADSVFTIAPIKEKYRDNTLVRQLQVSNEMPIIAVLGGLRYLIEYPHGCTEQRLSRALPSIVYQDMWKQLGLEPLDPHIDKYVRETLVYLGKVQDDNGLFAYWPGGKGEVHLTAYAVEFLTTVKKYSADNPSEYGFDETVYNRAVEALERAARSDYSGFINGYQYFERCAAIEALGLVGKNDIGYLKQLAYQAQESDIESQARIYSAIVDSDLPLRDVQKDLEKEFWSAVVFKKRKGKEVFAGFQTGKSRIGAVIHSTDISHLAVLVSALSKKSSKPEKVTVLANALIDMGGEDGWGNTHNNGVALLALHDRWESIREKGKDATFELTLGGKPLPLTLSGKQGMLVHSFTSTDGGVFKCTGKSVRDSFYVKLFERYLPQAPGSMVKAAQEGFVVKRQIVYPSDTGGPSRKIWIDTAGQKIRIPLGSIVEEHVQITNPKERHFVAVVVPLAAGVEYCNPELKTASADFATEGSNTSNGSYSTFLDDRMVYYFNTMQKGTFDFYFRVRATTEGEFTQPPARAEMMYEDGTYGNSTGAAVIVKQ